MAVAEYDVCIVGAGPGALAALSAVMEPYSIDQLSSDQAARAAVALRRKSPRAPRVCVIDPAPWLSTWMERFEALEIKWLRSPATAHPDLFDALSLRGFARSQGREAELRDSGAGDDRGVRGLHEASAGAWQLPSNALFKDFCQELIERLPHQLYQAKVTGVSGCDGDFAVDLDTGIKVQASAVVLALGVPGPPVMPSVLAGLPQHLAFHTDFKCGASLSTLLPGARVLVLGGGLTAVQTAQLAHRRGCHVVLLSRRPLTTRHFDIDVKWFDRRRTQQYLFEFLSLPVEQRLRLVKEARGGGSVPKMYMEDLRAREASGRLEVLVGEAQVVGHDGGSVQVEIDGRACTFDKVVSACGHRPDCCALPLVADLQRQWPATIHGGLPVLSQDLQWAGMSKLFVVGALAALQVGPDAGNLMGLRRAAQVLSSALDLRGWLREVGSVLGNIRGNRYSALFDDSSEDESESSDCVDGAGAGKLYTMRMDEKSRSASESTEFSSDEKPRSATESTECSSDEKPRSASESTECSSDEKSRSASELTECSSPMALNVDVDN